MAKNKNSELEEVEAKAVHALHEMVNPTVALSMEHSSGIETPYEVQFRSSKLPFCPREFVIHMRTAADSRPVKSDSYGFNFFVKIGSAVHSVVQTFLGMSGVLFGHWSCCGVTELFREGSAKCPVCGNPQQYEELGPKSILGMHVDGVSLKWRAVLEFKTTSGKKLPSLKDPYPQHLGQASCYLKALNAEHGWKLDKLVFVYFSRDSPRDFKVFVREPLADFYSETLDLYSSAHRDLEAGVLPDRICTTVSDGLWRSCPYTGVCFTPNLESQLIPVESLVRS